VTNHFAFISYASRYGDWVKTFHGHLEAALKLHGENRPVFFDQLDLSSGTPWQNTLQAGVSDAEHLILVATPETFASPWTESEFHSFAGENRDRWRTGYFHTIRLVDCPLPPFLSSLQAVDFRGHDEDKYRQAFQDLLAGLLGRSKRNLPKIPALEAPSCPDGGVPPELRGQIVAWLTPLLQKKAYRSHISVSLGFGQKDLDSYPSFECAASGALVRSTGSDAPAVAALRVVRTLIEEMEEDEPEKIVQLRPVAEALKELAEKNPDEGLLQHWLAKVVEDHNRLTPYFQQQEELTLLDQVYVPLALQLREREMHKGEMRPGGEWRLRDLLELDPEDHDWVTRRWVVKGHPGAGKTTLLRHLAASVAGEADRCWVPVLESLPRLMRDGGDDGAWLLKRIERRMRRAGEEAVALTRVLERAGKDGRLLLLLDGLDEVRKESRDDALALLRDLSTRWPHTPIVVASRPIGYQAFDAQFVEVELQDLGRDRRLQFLGRWFGRGKTEPDTARAEAALKILEGDPSLWELSGNPLYLTLMALLLEQGSSPEKNRTKLYDQVFDLLLDGKNRGSEGKAMDRKKAVQAMLGYLGFSMTEDNKDAEPREEIEDRLYRPEADKLRDKLERVPRWKQSLRPFLDDLAERTGILGPHDGPDADWRFWHRTFREALAAERLVQLHADDGEAGLLAHAAAVQGDESRWAEPYALLTGRLKEPDALVKSLVKANPTLGYRALATAQTLSERTIHEILELSENPDERGKVYQRLPDLVGEGERTLGLIDRLRKQTRNGDDLFFLDLAVRQVADRWPEQAKAADTLLARFFEHIPAPDDADLFRTIETPLDGPVPLWRNIPAGSFLMGSPEDEEGRDEDEGPQHTVAITQSFGVAAVPVTNRQYRAFDPNHRWETWEGVSEAELADHPVVNVSWYGAVSFCRWLANQAQGWKGARLATEEEWEYACRGGTQTRYWSGDKESQLAKVGWYDENSKGRTHRVGEKGANDFGLYDVHGNVWEWTVSQGANFSNQKTGIEHDPRQEKSISPADLAEASGEGRVVRGGGYWFTAPGARSACRGRSDPRVRWRYQGFRVVVPVAPEP